MFYDTVFYDMESHGNITRAFNTTPCSSQTNFDRKTPFYQQQTQPMFPFLSIVPLQILYNFAQNIVTFHPLTGPFSTRTKNWGRV